MSTTLTSSQRAVVLQHVREALARVSPAEAASSRPGGAKNVVAHLDTLIEIVRRTTDSHLGPYQVQILEDVCDQCAFEGPASDCNLRRRNRCLLQQHTQTIIDAIARALVAVADPQYLQVHPKAGVVA